jgi:Conjugal transfer protein TraD
MTGSRDWQKARRARTRLLIEYGGLVVKAGLAELLEDDRATLLGGLLSLRDRLIRLDGDPPETVKLRWRRRGLRAFDEDAGAVLKEVGNRKEVDPGLS